MIIDVLVDWGKAFVDKNGSFYCGTTEGQKDTAARTAREADTIIYLSDVHTRKTPEFVVNGSLYPAHNLVKRDWYDLGELGVQPGQTVSPELTDKLAAVVKGIPSGLVVPRHVYFQSGVPDFTLEDIEETFGISRLDELQFLDGQVNYVINAKHFFDGTRTRSTHRLGPHPGIPDDEYNVFDLLKEKYGPGEGLTINHTGVVAGICIYHTAAGTRQLFPAAEVNIISDGITHLLAEQFGFSEQRQSEQAMRGMCKQLGINYISSQEYLGGAH
ncbi:MAG: hypothetical protein KJ601_08265 [Nanoarchaeota archaeon]|nr:hypothetical protein [Nanoarchaeota archaeon]MBU1704297.1 hypothetical protein [Nanoarchaeota archaeon]